MPTLTDGEKAMIRQWKSGDGEAGAWSKAQIGAAAQAVEDRLEQAGTQTAISNDIEAAAPGVFTGAQKRKLFLIVCLLKARQIGLA